MEQVLELYLEFLEREYGYDEDSLKERKEEILKSPFKDYSLAYSTNGMWTREFQVNINFSEKKAIYLVDNFKIKEENYTIDGFICFLGNLEFDRLIGEFFDYEEE